MQPFLLDTNVLIRFFNDDEPHSEMIERAESVVIHPVVYAEYMSGLDESTKGGRAMRRKLEEFLDDPVVSQCEVMIRYGGWRCRWNRVERRRR